MWGWVYIFLMVGFSLATLKRPYFALVALLCMFGLEQWGTLYLPFLRAHPIFTNAAVFAILAVALVIKPPAIRLNLSSFQLRGLSALLLIYAFISHFWAPEDAEALYHWKRTWPYLLASVFLAALVVRTEEDMQKIYKWFVWIGGFLLLLFAFVPEWQNRHIIISGNYNQGLKLALPLALAQLSGYVLIASLLSYRPTILSTAVVGAVTIAVILVMLKSGGRGSFIFSVATVMLMVPFVWGRGIAKKILPVGLFGLATFAVLNGLMGEGGGFSDRWSYDRLADDFAARVNGALFLIGEAFKTPTGILFGLGNSASYSADLLGIYPHIVPLEVLAEEGFIGFGLFVWFSAKTLFVGLRVLKALHVTSVEKQVLAITFACWIFTMFLSLKQGSLITSPSIFLFAALLEKLQFITRRNILRRASNEATY